LSGHLIHTAAIIADFDNGIFPPCIAGLGTQLQPGIVFIRRLGCIHPIDPLSVIADRIVGKPYLEIDIDRHAIAQYGIDLQQVQDVIEIAIGGKQITTTVEGRERYPVRVRYLRELRDHIDTIGEVLVPAPDGTQIPLVQLADLRYVPGPQVIKSENTFIVGYVLFEKKTEPGRN
jgi:Cu(I)/Ag(I) efflux system membrane protein CusA/SilA